MQHPVRVGGAQGNAFNAKLKSHVVLPVAPPRKSDLNKNGVQIVRASGSRCDMLVSSFAENYRCMCGSWVNCLLVVHCLLDMGRLKPLSS